jgi:hypothetical protein
MSALYLHTPLSICIKGNVTVGVEGTGQIMGFFSVIMLESGNAPQEPLD